MFIGVFGPSGAGKSSCCKAAATVLSCGYIDIDGLIQKGAGIDLGTFFSWAHRRSPSTFFDFGKTLCAAARTVSNGRKVLVAIGAGSIDYAQHDPMAVADWLTNGFDHLVYVTDDPAIAFKRQPLPGRLITEYKSTEFAPHRTGLYGLGILHDVAGSTEAVSQASFTAIVRPL